MKVTPFLLAAASALLAAPMFVGAQIATAPFRHQEAVQRRRRLKNAKWVGRDLKGNAGEGKEGAKVPRARHVLNLNKSNDTLLKMKMRKKELKNVGVTPPKDFIDVDAELMVGDGSMPLVAATAEEEVFKTMNVDSADAGGDLPSETEVVLEPGLELPPTDEKEEVPGDIEVVGEMGLGLELPSEPILLSMSMAATTDSAPSAAPARSSKAHKSPVKPESVGREKPKGEAVSPKKEESPEEPITILGQKTPANSCSRSRTLAVSAVAGAVVLAW